MLEQHSAPEAQGCTAGTQVAALAALVSAGMLGNFVKFAACSQPKPWVTDLNGRKSDW